MSIKTNKKVKELLSISRGNSAGFIVDDDLPYAIRRLKKTMKTNGRLTEVFDRREYIKPSDQRRKIKNRAIYLQKKKLESDLNGR